MRHLEELATTYRISSIQYCDSLVKGNHKLANKEYSSLEKIRKSLESDKNSAAQFYRQMLTEEDYRIRYCAAVQSKMLGVNLDQSERVLKEIAERTDIGIISFNAGMSLRNWQI